MPGQVQPESAASPQTQSTTPQQSQPTPQPAQTQASQPESELERLRREVAELKGTATAAELAKAREELANFGRFRAEVEAGVRQDLIRAHLPPGLPDKVAQLLIRGVSAELGAFEVDVTTRTAKDGAKFAETLKAYGLDALRGQSASAPAQVPAPQGLQILPPPVTQAQAQRPPGGVLKPSGGSTQRPASLASSVAAEVLAAMKPQAGQ